MKKLNVLLLSAVALGMTVVSCSKDDKDSDSAGIKLPAGKYYYDTATETKDGKTSEPANWNNTACEDINYLEFQTGGTMKDGYVDADCVLTVFKGTWEQTGNVVKIEEEDGYKLDLTLVSVTDKNMVAQMPNPKDPSAIITITFKK